MALRNRPLGITALSLFFVFGAVMSALAAVMLPFPGSVFEPLWRLNPHARDGFSAMGTWAVLLMATVCVACGAASMGLWRYKRWGLWIALTILCVNLVGDLANAILAHDWHTLIGLPIGSAMVLYLCSQRGAFVR